MMTIFVIVGIFWFSKERQRGGKKKHEKKTKDPHVGGALTNSYFKKP
jgi:hypothetical protein